MRRERGWGGSLGAAGVGLALASLAGCDAGAGRPEGPPYRGLRLEVAAVGDPAILEVVRVQGGEWARAQGVELDIRPEPVGADGAKSADVVVFPGRSTGDLVDAGALAVVPDSAVRPAGLSASGVVPKVAAPGAPGAEPPPDPLDFDDVAQPYREQVSRYGEDRVGLPLGGSVLVLAYRRDAFAEAHRDAAKAAGVALEPPRTWEQLDALARFFHGRDWDGDGEPEAGVALALGADPEGLGTATFLARAAALGQPKDRYDFLFDAETMAPRAASPPFVEALERLVALKDAAPEGAAGFDAAAARRAFREGEAALLIDRAERAGDWVNPKQPFGVAVAPLPGSPRVYEPSGGAWMPADPPNRSAYLPVGGGWLAGVSSGVEGKQREAAFEFLRTLAGSELAGAVASDPIFPMVPVRQSHWAFLPYAEARNVEATSWGVAVRQAVDAPRVTVGLRIPESDAYLADLDAARARALDGTPAAEALAEAAKAWDERTERLGRDRQLWHYRRSLNALATDDQPPPRGAKGE
jgi:multiple sugar transport system substrate-binding protein